MVNAWNVGALDQMVLPPCHYGFQVYTRELSIIERGEIYRKKHPEKTIEDFPPGKMDVWQIRDIFNEDNIPTRAISLMWNQRSVDTFLGLPFNIASYGLLLEIIAKEVNMIPDELIGNLGDVHLYKNHIEQAKEQITREPMELPSVQINPTLFEFGKPDPNKLDLDYYSIHNFELLDYQSHPSIKAPLSN
jgi:thymidylate synthase